MVHGLQVPVYSKVLVPLQFHGTYSACNIPEDKLREWSSS